MHLNSWPELKELFGKENRRCGLVKGSVSLEAGFECSKAPSIPSELTLLHECSSRGELSVAALVPCQPAWCHAPGCDSRGLYRLKLYAPRKLPPWYLLLGAPLKGLT